MIAVADMMDDIDGIALSLHGRRQGDGWLCRCPVPTHGKGKGDRNPSLSIRLGNERLLVHCFGGCDSRDVLDELRRRGLVKTPRPALGTMRGLRPREHVTRLPAPHLPDPEAVALWRSAIPVAGTLAADYLAGRGLAIDVAPSLRFLPSYPVGRRTFPAMVVAVQSADRTIVAVQLTFLDAATAKKATLTMPRKTIGTLGEGAVRALGLAEGTESALGAMLLTKMPAWATLGAKRMHRVDVPPEVRMIHIFADDDGSGHDAAQRTAAHHKALGRDVAIRLPALGAEDWAAFAQMSGVRSANDRA